MPRRFATREELVDAAAAARRRARPHADGAGHPRAARHDAVDVAVLAHVRLALERAARGRLRRRGRGGAARAGDRAGRRARARGSAACRTSATGPRRAGATTRCSPSGRSTGCSTRAAGRGRRSSSSSASASRRGRRRPLRRLARAARGRGDRREARQAELALPRRAHGRQRVVLDELVQAGSAAPRTTSPSRERERACPSCSSRLRSFSPQ